MKSRKQLVLENKIRKMVREELDENDLKSQQSKPIMVGKNPVTVGLRKGTIYIYNENMTAVVAQFNLQQLKLLVSMSEKKTQVP